MVTEDDISEVTSESSNPPNANGKHKRKRKGKIGSEKMQRKAIRILNGNG